MRVASPSFGHSPNTANICFTQIYINVLVPYTILPIVQGSCVNELGPGMSGAIVFPTGPTPIAVFLPAGRWYRLVPWVCIGTFFKARIRYGGSDIDITEVS
ncbi:hypothetical protein ES703_47392 [subsurface metagenome]